MLATKDVSSMQLTFNEILKLTHQLSKKEQQALLSMLESELPKKKPSTKEDLKALIKNAPTWSEEEYEDYKAAREHINTSRIA